MSDEFHLDIDAALENAKKTDLNGFTKDEHPTGVDAVKIAINNAEFLCGLDRKEMAKIMNGEFSEYDTLNSVGRSSKKIVIEYDIKQKKENE